MGWWWLTLSNELLAGEAAILSFLLAQCVMCARTAAAQNLERVAVLNHGILILILPPIAGLLAILTMAWRRR